MERRSILSFMRIFLAATLLSACNDNTTNGNDRMQPLHVTGKLSYRARIALPPDSVAHVNLLDVSIADRAAESIESISIPLQDKQVPIDFELTVAADKLQERHQYSIRATINRSDGTLLWTTDSANPISTTGNTELGTLTMVQVGARRPPVSSTSTNAESSSTRQQLQAGTWVFKTINTQAAPDKPKLFIKFSDDSVSGNAGCNQFTGSYQIKDNQLTLGPLAATLRACVPGLDETEHRLLSILNAVNTFELDKQGTLTLKTEDGRFATASREAQ